MTDSWFYTFLLGGAFLMLFASAEFLFHVMKLKAELTRKYVHFSTGFITMLFPLLIGNHWLVLLLCGSFAVLLVASKKVGFLPSINAIDRESSGSLLYPIVVYGCYLAQEHFESKIYFYVPVLILAVADPMAALFGKRWAKGKYTIFGSTKTLVGSFSFFLAAFLTAGFVFYLNDELLSTSFMVAIIVALTTTLAEAVSHKGFDNLTIPLTAMLTCLAFL